VADTTTSVPRVGIEATQEASPSLGARWYKLRNRILASPGFQRWSSVFPLSRPIANYHSRALFDLCAGFIYSQILMTAAKVDLFTFLAEAPKSLDSIALHTKLPRDAAERLVRAGVPLKLFERHSGERYGLGILGAALLGNPGVLAMIAHHDMAYADLRDPVRLLKGDRSGTALAQYWGYASATDPQALKTEEIAAYTQLMSTSQQLIAEDILDAYPFEKHHTLLDVGGGDGSFLSHVGARHQTLQLKLFDLPAVADKAKSRFASAGFQDRAEAFGGDFTTTPLPRGADAATLVRVLLDHDDQRVAQILKQVHAALPSGGTLIIAEPICGLSGAETVGDAYFGFYLLAMGKGRARSRDELEALLTAAGFTNVQQKRTRRPLMTGMMTAFRA
jgi:demethylspheroidene O-methyltransferase